jgi:site-specific DNA recombinase
VLGREEARVEGHRAVGAGTRDGAEAVGAGVAGGETGAGGLYRPLKIAAIYARVSTERQEKEQTVDSQLDGLRRAAKDGGYEVAPSHVFVDERRSGAHLDRPGLDRLRDLASEGTFEAVLISSPDRLARHYAYQVLVMEELQRAGCEVVFLNHAFGETPEERMLLQIQGVFAEYERALIKERSRRGRLFAARQGRVSWSHAPYGYRLIRKTESAPQKLVVDETEAEVVRQIFRWCVEDGLSCYAMEKLLRERGIPTRKGRALGWYQSTVGDILRDTVYKGLGYYNRTKRVDAKKPVGGMGFKDLRPGNLRSHAERPKEEWIPVTVPAVVDPETWDLAQEQLRKNRERATRNNTKHHYLLRGLLVCGECGKRMIGWWTKNGGRYVCADRYPRHEPWACNGRSVMAREVEGPIWEYVKELLSDPELLKARYEEGRGDPAVDDAEEREKERIGRKLKALDREVGRLIDAYQAEVIDLADLKERRERIEEHGRMLKRRLSEIREKRAEREQEVRLLRGLEQFSESVAGALEDPSFETRQQVLRLVVDRIVVEEERVVVHHLVPTGPVRLQTERLDVVALKKHGALSLHLYHVAHGPHEIRGRKLLTIFVPSPRLRF